MWFWSKVVAFLSIKFFKKLDAVSFNSGTGVKKSCKPLQWRILGEGPAYQTWRLFDTKILTSAGYISLFSRLIFLMKHALHFAVKLNSRDIQKYDCFGIPSYVGSMICSRSVPAPTAIGVHRLRNMWSSLWEEICHTKVQQSFLNQSLDPSNQKFLDPPLLWQIIAKMVIHQ